jgi:hypothetical protein
VAVTVESERLAGGATRVRAHAATSDGDAAEGPSGRAEASKRRLAERDRKVSRYFLMTAIVLLADRDAEASGIPRCAAFRATR